MRRICGASGRVVSGGKSQRREPVRASIHELWPRIKDMISKAAVVRTHDDCILEITEGCRYVRIVCGEDRRADRPFQVMVYERDTAPKTLFYDDRDDPRPYTDDEAVKFIAVLHS
jgi:aminoglycoside phosphotransferase (APT) family kinase protein